MTREFLPAGTAGIIEATPAALPATLDAEAVVVFLTEGGVGAGAAAAVDTATGGMLARLASAGELSGRRYDCVALLAPAGMRAGQVVVVGLGRREEVDAGVVHRAAATAARHLAGRPRSRVAFLPDPGWTTSQLEQAVVGGAVGMVGQDLYRTEPRRTRFGVTCWVGADAAAVLRGATIAEGVNLARRLVNMSPDHLYPESFAEEAAAIAGRTGLEIEIWDEDRLRRERCAALLAVAKGSARPPRLVLLRYRGRPRTGGDHPDLAFVGKGVTFDSGGISIKPAAAMDEMKFDMTGAASVLGVMRAVATLELPINVVGVLPATENLPDGNAIKPGDVVTSLSGQTIEILNTDAEGRLILCDALTWCARFEPAVVIDIATLTGACVIALGSHASGLLSNHDALANELLEAGQASGDRAWRLPLWEDYQKQIDSPFADMANVGGREAGTITAACFLARFTRDYHWAHLDIAGTAWTGGKAKGSTGRPVPLLMEFLLKRSHATRT